MDRDPQISTEQRKRPPLHLTLAALALLCCAILFVMLFMQQRTLHSQLTLRQADVEQADRQLTDFQKQLADLSKQQQTVTQDLDALRNTVRKQSSRPEATWVLKQAAYYIRLSILTQDVQGDNAGVLALLQEADALLAELSPQFATLRQALATKLLALKNQPTVDKLKVLAQLNSLAEAVSSLPLAVKIPEKNSQAPSQVFFKLITIRRYDEPIKALLTTEAEQAIQQNIQLLLQQAQWAVLQRDQAIYQTSLQGAARWISQYYDTDVLATKNMLATLKSLQEMKIAPKPVPLADLLTLLSRQRS